MSQNRQARSGTRFAPISCGFHLFGGAENDDPGKCPDRGMDDEPVARQTLSEWLRRKNFLVIEAGGGRQAIERIRKDEPDIVISDMVMPGMDGLQLLEKSIALRADVPFLMITGYPSHSAAVKALKHGASDFLAKPFKTEELTRRVNRTLLQKSASRPLGPSQGIAVGVALSAILWALVIGAIATILP